MMEMLDFDAVNKVALESGIDLNTPLTKESCSILNVAMENSSYFPDGTMVQIMWNDETNQGVMVVHATTFVKAKNTLEYQNDLYYENLDRMAKWYSCDYPDDGKNTYFDYKLYDANSSSAYDLFEYGTTDEHLHGGAVTVNIHHLDGEGGGNNWYSLQQTYAYPLDGNSSINNNLESIDETMRTDNWIHEDFTHAREVERLEGGSGHGYWSYSNEYGEIYPDDDGSAFRDERGELSKWLSRYEVGSLEEMEHEIKEEYDPTGVTDEEILIDNFHPVADDSQTGAYGILDSWREDGYELVSEHKTSTVDGYLQAEEVIRSENNQIIRNTDINIFEYESSKVITDHISKLISNTDDSLHVEYDYRTNTVTVHSDYFGVNSDGSPIVYTFNPLDQKDPTGIYNTRESKQEMSSYMEEEILTHMDNDPNFAPYKTLRYINEENGTSESFKIIRDNKSDNVILKFDNYECEVSYDELLNPSDSKNINYIKRVTALKKEYSSKNIDISIQKVNNEYLIRSVDANDSTVKYFRENDDGTYTEIINENGKNIEGNRYQSINSNDSIIHPYNSRIAKSEQRSISVVDETLYDKLVEDSSKIDINLVTKNLEEPEKILKEYSKDVKSYFYKISKTSSEVSEDIILMGKIITKIVDLFASCDKNMKDLLDNILFGNDDIENSFVDDVFDLRNNISASLIPNFQKRFIEKYDAYLVIMEKRFKSIEMMLSEGEIMINISSDEYQDILKNANLNIDLSRIIKQKDGLYYIDVNDLPEFKDYSNNYFSKLSSITNIDDIKNIDLKEVFGINDDSIANILFKTTISPIADLSLVMSNYDDIYKQAQGYIELKEFKPFVKYIFDERYLNKYKDIMATGMDNVKDEYKYMSPFEMAMCEYLYDDTKNAYLSTLSRKLRMREGKDKAVNRINNILTYGITKMDYVSEGFEGTIDGILGLPRGFAYLFGDKQNSVDDWEEIYVEDFITNNYYLAEVEAQYKNGYLSENEYELLKRLTGSSQVSGSYDIAIDDKLGLRKAYDIGEKVGDMITDWTFKGIELGVNYFFPAVGAALISVLKNAAYGLSDMGDRLNESYEESYEQTMGLKANANWSYAILSGLSTFGMGYFSDYKEAQIKGEDFNFKDVVDGTKNKKNILMKNTKNTKNKSTSRVNVIGKLLNKLDELDSNTLGKKGKAILAKKVIGKTDDGIHDALKYIMQNNESMVDEEIDEIINQLIVLYGFGLGEII